MKKNIEWLKEEIWNQDIIMDKGYIYTDDLMSILNEVDEPEVLSQGWIEDNEFLVNDESGVDYTVVESRKLKGLLVPKQGEVDRAYKDGYDKGKEHGYQNGYSVGFSDSTYESEITEEQAWYFIAKKYNQEGSYWFDARNHYLKTIEKPVIPQFVADFIKVRKGTDAYTLKYILTVAMNRDESESLTKEYDWIAENDETFARAWLAYPDIEIEQEPKYYAKIKGHELTDHTRQYWYFFKVDESLNIGMKPNHPLHIGKLNKIEWANLGITDDNADFELVEEVSENV